jgi:hypothetical protein
MICSRSQHQSIERIARADALPHAKTSSLLPTGATRCGSLPSLLIQAKQLIRTRYTIRPWRSRGNDFRLLGQTKSPIDAEGAPRVKQNKTFPGVLAIKRSDSLAGQVPVPSCVSTTYLPGKCPGLSLTLLSSHSFHHASLCLRLCFRGSCRPSLSQ